MELEGEMRLLGVQGSWVLPAPARKQRLQETKPHLIAKSLPGTLHSLPTLLLLIHPTPAAHPAC